MSGRDASAVRDSAERPAAARAGDGRDTRDCAGTITLGIYEKDTGRGIVCDVAGFPYTLIWSAPAKPVRFVCIEPWHSLPGAQTDTQEWSQRAAAACLAPGQRWATTLSTTFDR